LHEAFSQQLLARCPPRAIHSTLRLLRRRRLQSHEHNLPGPSECCTAFESERPNRSLVFRSSFPENAPSSSRLKERNAIAPTTKGRVVAILRETDRRPGHRASHVEEKSCKRRARFRHDKRAAPLLRLSTINPSTINFGLATPDVVAYWISFSAFQRFGFSAFREFALHDKNPETVRCAATQDHSEDRNPTCHRLVGRSGNLSAAGNAAASVSLRVLWRRTGCSRARDQARSTLCAGEFRSHWVGGSRRLWIATTLGGRSSLRHLYLRLFAATGIDWVEPLGSYGFSSSPETAFMITNFSWWYVGSERNESRPA